MSSAETVVAARIACKGVMPRSTRAISSLAFRPCGMAGASVPHATLTPSSMARLTVARALGNTSAALACNSGAARETSMPSARYVVATRNVPRSTISRSVWSLASEPCSMQSMPASTAARMASSPWAWAATLRPRRWASSTIALSSSSEYCWAPGGPVCDMIPPDTLTLMTSAPCFIW